jgi:dipeptidyl aminopeptidase/acylaminoacyl peptidase
MDLYSESTSIGFAHREQYLNQVVALTDREGEKADQERQDFFQPDLSSPAAYQISIGAYREQFKAMLGWPLTQERSEHVPVAREAFVSEDSLGRISRLWIETLPGLEMYGMLFVPRGGSPRPLVISQHGGGGSPELCSGLYGPSNYNDMTRRVLEKGAVVFAPQLLLWSDTHGPSFNRHEMDSRLKQLGGSITALEIYQLQRCLDYLVTRPEIIPGQVGMLGLSYGGFYTLFTAAIETRIRAALSSCFFNDRKKYAWPDWSWFGSARRFLDAEVAALVCPRALWVEVGDRDELFTVETARLDAQRVQALYDAIGLADQFCYKEFEGGHELDPAGEAIEFLMDRITRPM